MAKTKNDGAFLLALDDLKNQGIVVKANELIQKPYVMTTQEKRLILILAATIRMEDNEFNVVRINLREINKLIGVRNKSIYKEIKDITKKLMTRVIEYQPADGELVQTHWVERAHYKDKKGYVEIRFSDDMKKYLLHLSSYFTQYRLEYALPLKSFYAIRLYEMLKMEYTTNKSQVHYDLEELKEKLGILPPKYKQYSDFKKKVILISQRQFLKVTDICFDFKEKKQRKKVVGLTFLIKPNQKNIEPEEAPSSAPDIERELYNRLVEYFCLPAKKAKEVLKKYSPEQLEENLAYVENEHQKGTIKNIASYTLKAIKDNYWIQTSLFEAEKEEAKAKAEKKERQNRQREKDEFDYDSYITQEVEKRKAQLPDKELDTIRKDIEKDLLKSGKKQGSIFNITLRLEVDRFLRNKWKNDLMSFEEWLTKTKKNGKSQQKAKI